MPGRQRIKVLAFGRSAPSTLLQSRLSSALSGLSIHALDSPPERGKAPNDETRDQVSMDVRMQRDQDPEEARAAILNALPPAPGLDVRIIEHVCFHGLEEEEDFAPCTQSLSMTRVVDGEVRNGRQ